MQTIDIQYYNTPVGELVIGSFDGKICMCDWRYRKMRLSIDARIKKGLGADFVEESSEVIDLAKRQLNDYFAGQRTDFDLPLLLVGTDFQKSVWNALTSVPYGQTESYLGLATRIGNPTAVRAVATANGANAISIIVPCHRIIGNNGALVGYAGGLQAKAKLLELESPQTLFRV